MIWIFTTVVVCVCVCGGCDEFLETHNDNYTPTYFNLVPAFIKAF